MLYALASEIHIEIFSVVCLLHSLFPGRALEPTAAGATFLPDVSLLNDSAQYPSCDAGRVGSAVLENTTLNTTTVAYYTGTTPGSSACFVCDVSNGYELNTVTNERVCRSNGTWSGSAIMCGML